MGRKSERGRQASDFEVRIAWPTSTAALAQKLDGNGVRLGFCESSRGRFKVQVRTYRVPFVVLGSFCCGKEVCVCLTVDRLTQAPFAGRRCQVSQNFPGACSSIAIGCIGPAPLLRDLRLLQGPGRPALDPFHQWTQRTRPLHPLSVCLV